MGNKITLDKVGEFEVIKNTLTPAEVTPYVKEPTNRYLTILLGQGIVTIDTVDFKVLAPHTLFISANSERLVANTSTSEELVWIEIG